MARDQDTYCTYAHVVALQYEHPSQCGSNSREFSGIQQKALIQRLEMSLVLFFLAHT